MQVCTPTRRFTSRINLDPFRSTDNADQRPFRKNLTAAYACALRDMFALSLFSWHPNFSRVCGLVVPVIIPVFAAFALAFDNDDVLIWVVFQLYVLFFLFLLFPAFAAFFFLFLFLKLLVLRNVLL